ncbi:MAG: cache domain-containing protein [Acidobacteriota bacterium]
MAIDRRKSKLSRLTVLGITLLVLVVPFALYYFVYVSSQQSYFTNRSHRSLSRIGNQVVDRVDGLRSVVENAGRRQCETGDEKIDKNVLIPYFETLSPFGTTLKLEVDPFDDDARGSAEPVVAVNFKENGSALLTYKSGGDNKFKQGLFSVTSYDTRKLFVPAIERFMLNTNSAADEGLFDRVIVADSVTGDVVFEHGLDSVTIVNLYDLIDSQSSSSGAKTEENESAANKKGSQDSRGRPVRGSSGMTHVRIAGADYQLFVQPIQLTCPNKISDAALAYRLTVGGLVRSDHMTAKTFSFSYTLLLLFILVVLMTTFSGPLIKLKLIGPKDRVRKSDVALAGCSAFFGMALVILSMLDVYTYHLMELELDDQLEKLARNVDGNLRTELALAVEQLEVLNSKRKTESLPPDVCSERPDGQLYVPRKRPAFKVSIFEDRGISEDRGMLDPLSSSYPYFNGATWAAAPRADGEEADQTGEQRIKFTTKRLPTAFVNVKDRRFFTDAVDGKFWRLTLPPDLPNRPADAQREVYLSVEGLTLRTSGENVAVISVAPDRDYVSALDTRLLSLYKPALPTGFSFCIIDDKTGGVLFHTDDAKNLDEDFFEECDQDRFLRSAVQTRDSAFVNLHYLGGSHRAFVTPIKDLPWSLVVLRDRRIFRTVNLEMMTLAGIAFTSYAVLLAITLFVIFLVRSKPRFAIVWPNDKWLARYRQVVAANAVLFVACLALVMVSTRGWLIVWALLVPGLGLAHVFLVVGKASRRKGIESWLEARIAANGTQSGASRRGGSFGRTIVRRLLITSARIMRALLLIHEASLQKSLERWWDNRRNRRHAGGSPPAEQTKPRPANWRAAYTLALISFLAVCCVAPTIAFFKLARDEQIKVFIMHGQISLAIALEEREDQVRSMYSSVFPPIDVGVSKEEFIKKRLDSPLDVYALFFFHTELKPDTTVAGEPLGGLTGWFLETFSPYYNETCVESLRLARGQSSDGRWESDARDHVNLMVRAFARRDDSRGVLEKKQSDEAAIALGANKREPQYVLSSVAPGFMSLGHVLLWLMLFVVAVLCVVTYFMVRFAARRLLLLDLETPRKTLTGYSVPADRECKRILVLGLPTFYRCNKPDDDGAIDLGSIEPDHWQVRIDRAQSPPDRTVIIERFEFNRHDPELNERKLRLLENLINTDRSAVVRSLVDPFDFALMSEKKGPADATDDEPDSNKKKKQADKEDFGETDEARSRSRDRWAAALSSFVRVMAFDPADVYASTPHGASPPYDPSTLFTAVQAGDTPWRYLESLAPRMQLESSDEETLILEVGDQAENYYRALWSACSREERMTLCRVARDGLNSRLDPDLRPLMQKNFIVRDPALRLMDEGFRRFVLRTAAEEGVFTFLAEIESHWEKLRAPLLLVLLGVIAFLFFTQKELFDSTISLVSAITGGGLTLLKLFGIFNKGGNAGAAQT